MEAVLRNFKMIPCPAGDSCTKPGCQWQHSWEKNPPATSGSEENQDEDGPRKRRKVASEPASAPTKLDLSSAKKPVSPPPLKRRAALPTSTPSTALALPKPPPSSVASTPTKPDQSIASRGVTSPRVTPRKPEGLNPRHLKSAAPATHDFRYKALKLLHGQFQRLNTELKKDAKDDEKKLVLSDQELIWLALDEEQRMASDKPAIYQNVIKNRIMTYKRMTPGQWKDERAAELRKREARSVAGLAKQAANKSVLGPPKVIQTGLTAQQEVDFLVHLYTPVDKLSQWGYVPVPPSDREIAKAREGEAASFGWEVCDRCSTRFQVFPGRREEDGALASGGQCIHHPGRTYFPERAPGDTGKPGKRYRCCQQMVGDSPGCTKGDTHVFKTTSPSRLAAVTPFVQTPPNPLTPKDRAVCFDCEMGYTVYGMELIRLTATSWPDGKELLDVLVRPVGEILDLNSRYSGVWPEDIINAEPLSASELNTQGERYEPEDEPNEGRDEEEEARSKTKKKMKIVSSPVVARDLLFSLISPETPLIGHGLENDLNAVRIVHPTLIDTILLYPHRRGLPMRHGLKMLMETQLNKAIQVEVDGNARGHDSAEDARAAGELVRLKVQEKWADMKSRGWRLVDGQFVPPGGEKGSLSEKFLEEGGLSSAAEA
ncbi:RNA exonuclease 3 [Madurella fahalii]|uniref:RNA exonuclease 3 n=1 Tax=Madurella fahalii TaxID=1157608 RepID=A0ABQ0GBP8_9PEZI